MNNNIVCLEQARAAARSKLGEALAGQVSHYRQKKTAYQHDSSLSDQAHHYILNVGTINPEKNLPLLINAWEKVNAEYQRGLKLVIVSEGENISSELEECLRSHIHQGRLLYLSKVPPAELAFLYSHAQLFVSSACADNNTQQLFSAMHHGCPAIVADIAVYKWVMADAAWYCDPMSEIAFAQSMAKLLYAEDGVSIRNSLTEKSLQRIKMFAHEKMATQWMDLFEKINLRQVI